MLVSVNKMAKSRGLVCSHCGRRWQYKGKLAWATCPSCLGKTKVKQKPTRKPTHWKW